MLPVADSLSWTTFGLAVGGAGLAALLLVTLVVLVVRRRPSPTSLELVLTESSSRVEAMLSELTTALDDAQAQTERARQLAEIGSTIDLDEVVARTLEASGTLLGVEAAMLILDAPRNGSAPAFVATVGLRPEEANHASGPRMSDWKRTRAALVTYLVTDVEMGPGENGYAQPLRGAAAVPIHGEAHDVLGALWAFWRTAAGPMGEEQVALLEELALRAGPAIENARRFQEARQLADMDALTGLHNYRFFHETLAREVARSHRYDRRLALVVFDVDDFKAVNDRVGHLAGDSVLAGAAQRMLSSVRSADIACRVGGDEFAVILPESSRSDAEALYERLASAIAEHSAGAAKLQLSAGIAELRADDDAVTFFKRADEALYRAKALGKSQAIASGSQADADAA